MPRTITALAFALGATLAHAQPLPTGSPEGAGFSAEGLARIDRFFEREIAANRVPGAVVAVARDGKLVYYKAFGFLDKDSGTPMPLDAVFSLASMTKPMVAVGALTLNEEGRLPLHAKLEDYFPAFANQKVGLGAEAKPAKPIFIQDLFRHTSGITYGGRGETPVHKLYPAGSAAAAAQYDGDAFIAKVASLPLLYDPGTVWDYSLSFDVLGLVVAKVAGQPLDTFMHARVWDRVRMPDATFHPTSQQRKRLAHPAATDPLSGKPQRLALLEHDGKFDCAGGCAFATVGDYVRFGQMLLDGGVIDGARVLSPKTVAMMTSNQLGPDIRNRVAATEPQRDGYGFGLGVAVRVYDGVAAVPGTKGDYSWNGANGTGWWNDPKERLVVVFGTAAPGDIRKYYREQVSALVYGAMTQLR